MTDENTSNDNHDDLHDRLIDGALRELVGGEAPPDLGPGILAVAGVASDAVAPASTLAATRLEPARQRSSFHWGALAVAVCLMVGAAILLLPNMQAAREAARRSGDRDLGESTPAATVEQAPDDDAVDGLEYEYETTRGPRDAEADQPAAQTVELLTEAPALQAADDVVAAAEPAASEGLVLGAGVNSDAGVPAAAASSATTAPAAGEAGGQPADATALYGEAEVRLATLPESAAEAAPAEESLVAGVDAVPNYTADLDLPFRGDAFGVGGGAAGPPAAADEDSLSDLGGARYARDLVESGYGGGRGGGGGGMGGGGYGGRGFGGEGAEGRGDGALIVSGGGRGGTVRLRAETGSGLWAEADPEVLRRRRLEAIRAAEAGRGPGEGGDQYARIVENAFLAISPATTDNRLSTFSIDVDTASYANVRQFLMQTGMLPPPDAVRIEELVNYFDYDYTPPSDDTPFASNVEVAACPWAPEHRLVRVGIKGREMPRTDRPKSNLVFLIDVSGSMDEPNKLPLLVEGMRMLTRELGENDRVAIVVYASTEGLALESTRGDQQQVILEALDRLSAGGSTAGGAGIQLAYQVAADNFVDGGVNRVILCTDGDFNVGVTSPAELQRLAETKAKDTGVFLTVLGFGRGNLNDAMMEAVADHGNGNYHYVDNRREARKVLVEEMTGTLITIAKDVKIQVEFNPAQVAAYRLIGYENRVLAAEDFNDDKKDAGEIGAGHMVTALYEIVPAGVEFDARGVDELRYAAPTDVDGEAASAAGDDAAEGEGEMLTLKIRYKAPDGDTSTKLEFPISDSDQAFSAATADFQFAAAVASFGMLLRGSEHAGAATYAGVLEIAESASRDRDEHGYRREFVELVQRARDLSGQ